VIDAIVVGGGFAGATAARELSRAGCRVVLLEARDRLGGRTWTSSFAGQQVEMGGTWVHWHQPHVWAELTRYGLELAESPSAPVVRSAEGEHDVVELFAALGEANRRVCYDAQAVLPRPHDPLSGDVAAIDGMSIADRIDQAALDEPEASWLASLWETSGSAYLDEVGLAAALRWFALAGFSYELMIDCVSRFKIARGTRALVEAIAGDGGAEIRLESPVAAVEHDGRRVAVSLRGGGTVEASVAVVALPLNVLGSIEFDPPLSEGKREAAAAGQASHGIKIWVRARGELGRAAIAAPGTAINYMQPEYRVEGDTLLVGFGPDSALLDPGDEAAVLAAAARLYPDADLVAAHGHDWVADEFARGTWSMYRPGQLTGSLRELQRPEGRVVFAGSDVANGWNGFVDGAIESGLWASRMARALIAGGGR
jgi:pseudooxynicotine oxidase